MSNPESTLQQRLAEIVGAAADPFAKVASADPQLDAIAEATFEQAEETPEAPELIQPVQETTEEQPIEAVAKEASVADMAVRDIVTNEHFQAGFRNAYAQRAGEIEDAIEKIAFSNALKRSFKRGAGSGALVGAGLGAAANMYRTHKQNQQNPGQPKQSLVGGALKGAAGGAALGAVAGTGLEMSDRKARLDKLKGKRKRQEFGRKIDKGLASAYESTVGRLAQPAGRLVGGTARGLANLGRGAANMAGNLVERAKLKPSESAS